jgi:hypothetical protein
VEHHLWPLFQWIRRKDADGFVQRDFLFFPFVWGGHDPNEGAYFTLWPVGGTFRSLFGKDFIFHLMFPLFAYTRLKEYETYHFLFPFFAWQTGEGNQGFRVLPFFGWNRKSRDGQVVADRYTLLWPLFTWEYDNLNTRNPFTAFAIFPFYGQTRSNLVDETTVLWPFFRKRVEKKDGITRWRAPFPFVMIATGNETQYDFWPFYGYRRNGGFTRHFALWPIFRSETHDGEKLRAERRWIMPIWWSFERTSKETGEVIYAQRKLWPLLRVDTGAKGRFGLHFPSLLWFNDSPEGNFESILSPLWELFRYRKDPEDGKELRLLFSAYQRRWDRPEGDDGWSVLGGLVGHRKTRDGDGRVRLLWFIEF